MSMNPDMTPSLFSLMNDKSVDIRWVNSELGGVWGNPRSPYPRQSLPVGTTLPTGHHRSSSVLNLLRRHQIPMTPEYNSSGSNLDLTMPTARHSDQSPRANYHANLHSVVVSRRQTPHKFPSEKQSPRKASRHIKHKSRKFAPNGMLVASSASHSSFAEKDLHATVPRSVRFDEECLNAASSLQSLSSQKQAQELEKGQASASPSTNTSSKLKKRVSRQCKISNCNNSVVQGGLCISHGARRKHCKLPGCSKNVKMAGLCSAHGPARKKCGKEECNNISVQGGLCISHGAKKKLCTEPGCTKKARTSWRDMCKRHFDLARQAAVPTETALSHCKVIVNTPA